MAHRMRHVLVTGGAGFIGANFVHQLLAQRPQVRIWTLDLLTYAGSLTNLDNLPDAGRHRFIHGDVADQAKVTGVLATHDIDTVVHFAAETHVDRSIHGPLAFVHSNITGTGVLLEACRTTWATAAGGRRFHYVSTDEVFGSLAENQPAPTEDAPLAPSSPYSASKAAGEHLALAWHRTFGLPVTISRCTNNFGPRQHAEKFIPTVIRQALLGAPIPIYGDGRNIRDWLAVEDHCAALLQVLERGVNGSAYHISANHPVRNIDLARAICRLLDARRPRAAPHEQLLTAVTDRPGHDWRYALADTRLESLGWRPNRDFSAALAHTVDWYLAAAEGFPARG